MKKGLLISATLALALGVGVAVGAHQVSSKEVAADGTTIYCKMQYDWWTDSGAAIGAYYWKDGENSPLSWPGTRMSPVQNDDYVWKTTIPTGYDKVIFTRMNPSDEGNQDWGAKTADLNVPTDDNVLYTISSSSATWGDPGVAGSWGTYEEPGPNDRMIAPVIDLGSLVNIEGFHYPEVHFYDAAGGTFSVYAPLHQVTGSVYSAHVTYHHNRVIDTVEFLFKEGEEDKFSEPLSFTPINKNAFEFKFNETWNEGDGGKWDVTAPSGHYGVPRLQQGSGGFGSVSFEADYEKQMYYATITVTDPSKYIQICYSYWNYGAVREASAFKQCINYDLNSFQLSAGTYDVFCYNSFEDNGVFEIKKYGDAQETKIYYVTNSADPTVDYIYSWGGTQQFGGFPGTAITAVEGVQELSRNGVVHFQGGDAKLIYQIPVTIGYPTGDEMFMFNNGTSEYKSAERELYSEGAYWWTGDPNNTAGDAIEFINLVETFRHTANDSICEIVQSNAQTLVNCYNAFTKEEQETYIDCTTVYSWTDTTKTSSKLYTYKEVMERLSLIAGIDLSSYGSGERIVTDTTSTVDSNSLIAVVSIISIVSLSSVAILVVIKKRKHN